MLPLMALMALAGAAKGLTIDKDKEERDRKLASETERYSPWTHLHAGAIQEADPIGSALAFGGTGASLDAGQKNASANEELAKNYSSWLGANRPQANKSPWQMPVGGMMDSDPYWSRKSL